MKRAIPYYRVSTERQGHSGLGLEAQQKAVQDYARANGIELLQDFIEVESGTKIKRPILLQALEVCKREGALLLIAKLDRLARNVAFVSKLMESDVDFIAVDIPFANKLIVHIMAAFAEYERDLISIRTKDALQAAKRRGVELGRYGKVLALQNKQASINFAAQMKPVVRKYQQKGYDSTRRLTGILNDRAVATFTGHGKWHTNTVHRLLKQIQRIE